MKNNRDNPRKKPSQESEDLLGIIRKRQEHEPSTDSTKLREFLARLKNEGTIDEDCNDLPGYKIGFEDGETAGYEIASQRFQDELRALRTMIDAMIDSK